jgi:hypothetical protein
MAILKFPTPPGDSPAHPGNGRRSFLGKLGAAMSAAVASTVPGMSSSSNNQAAGPDAEIDRLSRKLGILEDEKSIRRLHEAYEACLEQGRYGDAIDLFAEDGEAVFNGGIFKGTKGGLPRLYQDRFRSGLTGRKIGPAPVFPAGDGQLQETISVDSDRLSAVARFSYSMQVGTPVVSDSILVKMARLHGGGIIKWCEGGICDMSCVKDSSDGSWKIQRLEYQVWSRTDYRPGKSHAGPVSVPLFSRTFPDDPSGPDSLTTSA